MLHLTDHADQNHPDVPASESQLPGLESEESVRHDRPPVTVVTEVTWVQGLP